MQSVPLQPLANIGDGRFFRYGRMVISGGMRGFRRIFPERAAHLIEPLGPSIPGLQFLVGKRPCRRHALLVPDLLEILATIAGKDCAEELGIAADIIVVAGIEPRAVGLIPGFLRTEVAALEYGALIPVLRAILDMIARFEDENVRARCRQPGSNRRAADPRSDDDDIRCFDHLVSLLPRRCAPGFADRRRRPYRD
jgi:hypothetical protein